MDLEMENTVESYIIYKTTMHMVRQDLFRETACASINDFYRLWEYYTSVVSKLYKITFSQVLEDYQVLHVSLLFHHSHLKDFCHAM
jgi:hypothetical protein